MKKIETTNILGNSGAPFLAKTHDHYVESILESTSSIIKGILANYTTGNIVIINGCAVTFNGGGTSTITAGAVYYNGEIYQVDAASIATPANTLVWGIVTTYRAGDPIVWSDGVSRNLHSVLKMSLTNAVTGTGLADYNAAIVINLMYNNWSTLTLLNSYTGNVYYRNTPFGFQMTGVISTHTVTSIIVGNVPAAFRPITQKQFIANSTSIGTAYIGVLMTNGDIQLVQPGGGAAVNGDSACLTAFLPLSI